MTFDIYQLDDPDLYEDDWDQALEEYEDELTDLFADSPEGQAYLEEHSDIGFWAATLIHYGFAYNEVTVTQMEADDVAAILTRTLPRKLSLSSPDEADDALPELIAFWQYLKREYDLPNAEEVLTFLQEFDPNEFKAEMNNPANFGMAKSFLQMGHAAGFDMTTNEGLQAFQQQYNTGLLAAPPSDDDSSSLSSGATKSKKSKSAQKKRRAMAKASRKRNRQKRK